MDKKMKHIYLMEKENEINISEQETKAFVQDIRNLS